MALRACCLFATALALRPVAPRRLSAVRLSVLPSTMPQAPVFNSGDSRPVILYDGVCNFCNFWVNFVLDNDPAPGRVRFAALQSPLGRSLLERSGRKADDISSIVLVTKDDAYVKSDAVLRIGKLIDTKIPVAPAAGLAGLLPQALRDVTYDAIAANRYNFLGKRAVCRITDEKQADRFLDGEL
ncbi:hypothetical protein M885DRAFT_482556 [Pelagophyceae sp. CCMP2097]|nr:hypothetical protein M885DRAFT_482556 [Pelagophyceae sp. CCMP2097]